MPGPQLADLIKQGVPYFTEEMSPAERDTMLKWGPQGHAGIVGAASTGGIAPMLMLQRPQRWKGTEDLPDNDPGVRALHAADNVSKALSIMPGGTAGTLNMLKLLIGK